MLAFPSIPTNETLDTLQKKKKKKGLFHFKSPKAK